VTSKWLEAYLAEAVRKKLCTKIHCTTCGALEFRRGVLDALSIATGRQPLQRLDRESVIEIAKALAEVSQNHDTPGATEDAVRCLLVDLWSGIPLLDRDIAALLAGSWAGDILHMMNEHHEAREADRRARDEFQSPAAVQKRREEKKLLNQEQHEKRLALKKGRDRLWREKRGKAD
jgi:hypothetical protein